MGVSQPREPTQVVGRYAVYGEIASGGMATIHLGRLLGPVGFSRTVAIKRLHAQYAKDPDFVAMFLDEARLAARIQNPNVVQTMDVVSEGDTLFLVMEYIQGEAFAKLWRMMAQAGQQIPLPIVSAVVVGTLHGLHAVHEATDEQGVPLGIVHRDISPQNVIVGIDGTPRVLDFGVAKAAGRLQHTRDGQLKGKLAYMAPEQLTGAPVARSSDIYAAAIVLWEALTGTRLYDGDNEARVMASVLAGNPPPPSHLVPDLPQQLDDVVMRGLDRDPAKRFRTAREMALALEAVVRSASATEVGAWVERLAHSGLAKRAQQVHELESSSAIKVPPMNQQANQQANQIASQQAQDQAAYQQPQPQSQQRPQPPPPSHQSQGTLRAVNPSMAANTNALETPNTVPQGFEPMRLPQGSVTEAFELGSDDDDLPTEAHASVSIVNGEIVYGAVEPKPKPAFEPLASPIAAPPPSIPDPPISSGSWQNNYDQGPQSQAALSQSSPWVAQSAAQYPGSNASLSGQFVRGGYDASQSIAYNPSQSVQIVTVPQTSTAMKVLIAIATIALVFAVFAVFMALRGNMLRAQEHAAANPSPPSQAPTSAPATPPAQNDNVAPLPTTVTTPLPLTADPQNAIAPIPSSTAAALDSAAAAASASAAALKKQQKPIPTAPPKPQRVLPKQIPAGCIPPFTLDANGVKIPKPECN